MTELQRAAGLDYPVTGTLDATVQAAGTEGNPHGQGQFTLTAAEAYGRPIKSASANLTFANHEAEFNHIRLLAARGVVAGSAAYNFNSKGLTFDLNGAGIDLAEIPELQNARLQTAGEVSFAAKGAGTIDEPVINGSLQVTGLVLNGERVGGLTANAVTRGRELQLTARSNFSKANLSLDGKVDLLGDMPGSFTLQFSNLDIDPFLRAEVRGENHGTLLDGRASHVDGPAEAAQASQRRLQDQRIQDRSGEVAIASDGPVELQLANEVLTVQRCALVSEDSRLAMSGTVSMQESRRLDLRADGNVNLKLVHTLDPDVTSYGAVNIGVTVTGDTAKPLINGRIQIVHGGLSMIDLPPASAISTGASSLIKTGWRSST